MVSITFGEVLNRYYNEYSKHKKGWRQERSIVAVLVNSELGGRVIQHMEPSHFAIWRTQQTTKPATLNRQLALARHALRMASVEMGYKLTANPLDRLRPLRVNNRRQRRLKPNELQSLLAGSNPTLASVIDFAVATGMRRSEILNLEWQDVDFEKNVALVRDTKAGWPREVPLSLEACAILTNTKSGYRSKSIRGRCFDISSNALRLGWQRLVKRQKITGLTFHDLRHEAISRFFELGLSLPEVMLCSGHKTPAMLMRYTHLRAETVATKLSGLQPVDYSR